jgi:hypothetical protein
MSEEQFQITQAQDPYWKCYMFGNTPVGFGMIYIPAEGQVPNWFVRWMMKVCLGCTWVKKETHELHSG